MSVQNSKYYSLYPFNKWEKRYKAGNQNIDFETNLKKILLLDMGYNLSQFPFYLFSSQVYLKLKNKSLDWYKIDCVEIEKSNTDLLFKQNKKSIEFHTILDYNEDGLLLRNHSDMGYLTLYEWINCNSKNQLSRITNYSENSSFPISREEFKEGASDKLVKHITYDCKKTTVFKDVFHYETFKNGDYIITKEGDAHWWIKYESNKKHQGKQLSHLSSYSQDSEYFSKDELHENILKRIIDWSKNKIMDDPLANETLQIDSHINSNGKLTAIDYNYIQKENCRIDYLDNKVYSKAVNKYKVSLPKKNMLLLYKVPTEKHNYKFCIYYLPKEQNIITLIQKNNLPIS